MASTRRQKRVGDQLMKELGVLLLREARDPRLGGVTITEVKVSPDLAHARVYFTLMGDEQDKAEALQALNKASGFLRSHIARQMVLRRVPELSFEYDEAYERGQRILEILDQIEREKEQSVSEVGEVDQG